MEKRNHIFVLLIMCVVTVLGLLKYHGGFWQASDNYVANSEYTLYKIKLRNDCGIADDYFTLEIAGKKEKLKFQSGIMELRVKERSRVRISVSERYPDFYYSDSYRSLRNGMLIVVSCGVDSALEDTFQSIRNSFSAKKR